MTKTHTKKPLLTVIIPAYNETVRLVSGLFQILAYLSGKRYRWELIIVDDGSDIPIASVIHAAKKAKLLPTSRYLPLTVYRLEKNSGKGRAIAYGVRKAKGNYVVFCDADLSVPITAIDEIMKKLHQYPVVITSRRSRGSKIVVHQPVMRELAGRIFTSLSNTLCATNVVDATCGCKGFSRKSATRLFSQSRIQRWVFDSEILFLARKYGYDVYELPVHWMNKVGSKVRLSDSIGSLYDLLRIRWYDLRGMYNK